MTTAPGTLYVVSTPIGNLGDITQRALDTLRTVDLILAEDTRHSAGLLSRFDVRTRTEAYHEHNEAAKTPRVLEQLARGLSVALVTDAGTPLVSDPGARLVRAAIDADVPVVPVPGASALLAALVASGLDADRFTFLGFIARKGAERARDIRTVAGSPVTCVLHEAPGRVGALLADLAAAGAAGRAAVVARELTKQFEEYARGTVGELAARYADAAPRGEVVVLVEGAGAPEPPDEAVLRRRLAELRASGVSAREAARVLSEELGASRNVAYRLAHE